MTNTNAVTAPRATFADLRMRLASALVLVVAAVGALVLGGTSFVLFWLAAGLAIVWEWQRLIGPERRLLRTLAGSVALSIAAALCVQMATDLAALAVTAGAIAAAAAAPTGRRAWAGAGVLYAGCLVVCVLLIRPALAMPLEGPFDVRTIVWLFAIVWGTDIAAYFAGRLIGGPKVWPAVSAGKTWSGTLVGIACGALAGLVVGLFRPVLPIAALPVFAVGLMAAAVSQAGDFLESGVKRRFSVKDSSQLIPGHGGVMDRLDGFIAAAAFVVVFAILRDAASVGEAVFRW